MRNGYMPEPNYQSPTNARAFNSNTVNPKTGIDLGTIPKKTEKIESNGIFYKVLTNIEKIVAVVVVTVIIALPFSTTAQGAEISKTNFNEPIPAFVEQEKPVEEQTQKQNSTEQTEQKTEEQEQKRQRPETVSSATDTFECYLTGVVLVYWENPGVVSPDTTYYGDIPFALQDSSGNVLDYETYEDTTGSYPAFFIENVYPPNPDGVPDRYEVLFKYRNKTLTEIEAEMDSINTYHDGANMDTTINDPTSTEWLRATMVKWQDDIYPRCRGPPYYWWVDITPNTPSRTFDDDFLLMDIYFSLDNPEYSGFQYLVNLNYIRELVSSVNVPDEEEKSNINGALTPYPNPTNNTFSFVLSDEYQNVDIKIYNTTGRLIKEINGFSQGQSIDLREYENPTGVYLISVFETNTDELIGRTKVTYSK